MQFKVVIESLALCVEKKLKGETLADAVCQWDKGSLESEEDKASAFSATTGYILDSVLSTGKGKN